MTFCLLSDYKIRKPTSKVLTKTMSSDKTHGIIYKNKKKLVSRNKVKKLDAYEFAKSTFHSYVRKISRYTLLYSCICSYICWDSDH